MHRFVSMQRQTATLTLCALCPSSRLSSHPSNLGNLARLRVKRRKKAKDWLFYAVLDNKPGDLVMWPLDSLVRTEETTMDNVESRKDREIPTPETIDELNWWGYKSAFYKAALELEI